MNWDLTKTEPGKLVVTAFAIGLIGTAAGDRNADSVGSSMTSIDTFFLLMLVGMALLAFVSVKIGDWRERRRRDQRKWNFPL